MITNHRISPKTKVHEMQRPKRKEDEADLLRFQDEFIRNQATPSARLQKFTKSVDQQYGRKNIHHAFSSTSESSKNSYRL